MPYLLMHDIARTAVAAGTAASLSHRVSRRQAGRWAAQGRPQQYGPPPAAAVDPMTAKLEQLKLLGELRSQGVLTDAEFAEQKQQILG